MHRLGLLSDQYSVHGILSSGTEFAYFCEIFPHERDYSMIYALGEETGALIEQSLVKKVITPLTFNS